MDDDVPSREELDRFRVGEDLYGLSVDELDMRIKAYQAEITRLTTELDKKAKEKQAADLLFKKINPKFLF